MIEALFLNPISTSRLKARTAGHKIKSKVLKRWQSVVKQHGGDMKAAAKAWKFRSRSKGSSRRSAGARRSRIAVKGLSGLAARRAASTPRKGSKGGTMAARKRRRNQLPPTQAWVEKWRKGMERAGRTPKSGSPKFRKISSDPNVGKQQWKGRYKRKLRKAMRRHVKLHRRSTGARSFARSVSRGLKRSTVVNPVTYAMWRSRFIRGTGYAPYKAHTRTGRKSRRRRGARPGTRRWGKSVVRGVRRRGAGAWARGVAKAGLPDRWKSGLIGAMKEAFPRLKNPRRRKSTSKRGRRTMKKYPIIRAAHARSLMMNLVGRGRRRHKKSRRSGYRRMRNPVGSSLKALATKPSISKYLYVTGGVVAGSVLPSVISKYAWKGVKSPITEVLLGVGSSILAGLGVAMATKDDEKGVLVAAGGLAAALGSFIVSKLDKMLGFSGLGQAAEDALKSAVEMEMKRAGLTGVGQFMLPSEAESLPGAQGIGQFLTEPEMQTDIVQTEGFGQAMDLDDNGSNAFAGIDGSVF